VQANPIWQTLRQCKPGRFVTKFFEAILELSDSGQCDQPLSQLQSKLHNAGAPCDIASLDSRQLEARLDIVDLDPRNAGLVLRYRQGEVIQEMKDQEGGSIQDVLDTHYLKKKEEGNPHRGEKMGLSTAQKNVQLYNTFHPRNMQKVLYLIPNMKWSDLKDNLSAVDKSFGRMESVSVYIRVA
jgi:hypothetical protein